MALTPYGSFTEWEKDMERIRACPNDAHLLHHVKGRVEASSPEIREQVTEYLQSAQFAQNPIGAGQLLAQRTGKMFFIRNPQDPWFHV